ncbi:SNF2 family DNA-dependent ATPase domain-containing protein, partial [Aureobasidium sp. EXF-3399]
LPVVKCGSWSNDEERTPDVVDLSQICHYRDGLYSLSKTHFIGQDTVDTLLVQVDQPIETLELVLLELALKILEVRDLRAKIGEAIGQVDCISTRRTWPDGLTRNRNVVGRVLNFISLDLLSNEMRVQFGLRDQEVQLSLLSVCFALGFSTFGVLQLLLLSHLALVTFVSLIALPEGQHLTHGTLCASLYVFGALVGSKLPATCLFGCELCSLTHVALLDLERLQSGASDLRSADRNVLPSLAIYLVVSLFAGFNILHGRSFHTVARRAA